MRKPIVILGGMGPQASLRFHQLLLEKSAAFHDGQGDQFPYIVHFSLPVADFISDESARHAAAETLRQLAPIIKSLHPGQITLACNTAHVLATEVDILRQPPFMSMLEVVAAKIHQDHYKKVGLLASPTTIRTKLYAHVLAQRGIAAVEPSPGQQQLLESAIRAVISGEADKTERAVLATVSASLLDNGAEALLLGCTELPLIFDERAIAAPVYDCLDIYAGAVIEAIYGTLAR